MGSARLIDPPRASDPPSGQTHRQLANSVAAAL
jgi:hypothetical protein